jgi:hypothetical protein
MFRCAALVTFCIAGLAAGCTDKSADSEKMNPAQIQAASAHTVGGKTVADAFPDATLRNLASMACAGDVTGVEQAVKGGVNPNSTGLDGVTPLVWAQDCRSLPGVEALLKAGANPNASFAGCSAAAVCFAARMEDVSYLKLLLKYGGDPNAAFEPGETALWWAFQVGIQDRGWGNYEALLDAGVDINRVHGRNTIAEVAVYLNWFDRVAELLDRGYSARLDYLGWIAQEHSFGGSPESIERLKKKRDKVVEMLKARGVTFPMAERPASAPRIP